MKELTVHIVLESPPIGVDFALQKGRGHASETIQTQRANENGKNLHFECPIKISENRDVPPDFFGNFVNGVKNERFIYLDIGTSAGQMDSIWSRRLKIPLRGITWAMVDSCLADANQVLVAHVAGTGKDGTPNCATVKPFNGWRQNI